TPTMAFLLPWLKDQQSHHNDQEDSLPSYAPFDRALPDADL
ncbi:uncharacterized protein METZ01_LOCUS385026, partial [marine metagenome]